MISEDERIAAERRIAAQLQHEAHQKEIREYEESMRVKARARFKEEDAKTNILYSIHTMITVCCITAGIGASMIIKKLAFDLSYDGLIGWYWCVGVPIAILIFRIIGQITESNAKKEANEDWVDYFKRLQWRNRKKGARQMAVVGLLCSLVFVAIPCGYVHCPHDEFLRQNNILRELHNCKSTDFVSQNELHQKCQGYSDNLKILNCLFWWLFLSSAIGLTLSWKLKNTAIDPKA